jgi:hypothetical protein
MNKLSGLKKPTLSAEGVLLLHPGLQLATAHESLKPSFTILSWVGLLHACNGSTLRIRGGVTLCRLRFWQ